MNTSNNSQFSTLNYPLPKGYKQTEVGVIPEDWEQARLGWLLAAPPTYGINAPAIPHDTRFPTYLRITDITEDGRFDKSSRASVNHPASENYQMEDGDLVFARTGASVGKSYLYEPKDGELTFAGFLIRIRPDARKLSSKYLKYIVRSQPYWNWVISNSMRSGQPGINGKQYALLPIPLPPTKAEQEAIAEALSDADALIESLEQLIAKKRQIKQGAMQELLTGKKRLPGFSGEWEVTTLGSLGVFAKGSGVRKHEANSGNLPCVRYGEIYTLHDDYVKTYSSYISTEVALTAKLLRKGDLLFAGSGETREEIGKCVAFLDDIEAYAGGDIVILRPEGVDSQFFGYFLNTPEVVDQKASKGQGDAVVHISAKALASIAITIPDVAEQTAIATILSDMDAEIAALETKLAKARQVKQGMMQELLTGRVRLVN